MIEHQQDKRLVCLAPPGEIEHQLNDTTSYEIQLLDVYKEGHFSS